MLRVLERPQGALLVPDLGGLFKTAASQKLNLVRANQTLIKVSYIISGNQARAELRMVGEVRRGS